MAGYIFSISSEEKLNGVKRCIKNGDYASKVPNDKLESSRGKQVAASVLADYCSMKSGDNVYFLSKRQIYGVGKLIDIGLDCKYKNYISAHELIPKTKYNKDDKPLKKELKPDNRWVCFFEPEEQFFTDGVDMDEVLSYKPESFRMLRAFQDVTFIKIDDEENMALKECIYLKNRKNDKVFEFSQSEHKRISLYNLEKYLIKPEETIINECNVDSREINLEMLLEAEIVDKINHEGFANEKFDYVAHQVIASPFKPISYIDKMDIFAYKYLKKYPDEHKPIDQYLVIELKKGRANAELLLQLMRYVDWISKEYASGDYSRIKAVGVASSYTKGIQKIFDEECVRSYLSDTHPNKTSIWKNIELYEYVVDAEGKLNFSRSNVFDGILETINRLKEIGMIVKNAPIIIDSVKYSPIFKVQKQKWAFFETIEENKKEILESNGWKVIILDDIGDINKVQAKISQLFQ